MRIEIDDVEKFKQELSKLPYLKIEGEEEYIISRTNATWLQKVLCLNWVFQLLKDNDTGEWFVYYSKNKKKEVLKILNEINGENETDKT